MHDLVRFCSVAAAFATAFSLQVAVAAAADLPNAPSSYPALAPSAADATPNYWSGLYVGAGISAWGGKGVKGGVGGDAYLGYDHAFDNGVIVGVRASTGYEPFLWSTPRGFTQFTGTAFGGGEAIVGYRVGQITPYVITGVELARPTATAFGGGAFNAADAINTVFSGPGAVQAVGTVGMGVTYQFSPNFSMGLEARMYKANANNNNGLAPLPY
jgi:outer membrane immunogenic protein